MGSSVEFLNPVTEFFSTMLRQWAPLAGIGLAALAIVAGGIAYKQEMEDDAREDEKVAELLQLTRANSELLNKLAKNPSARPLKFDACDGAKVITILRDAGVSVSQQDFETRCAAEKVVK